ncbi:MAG: hypothetical protein ACD_20C00207G0009 [uncultured bacterium]|nr:MAG: hypothetical protein ACD_20C00207G0009 [uncultured bacterium]HBH19141.1 cobalamin biosynthesis protein CobD [Cyanobacteria bacterium UBA9579]
MIWGDSWILIAIIAVAVDLIVGEFPGKHPVQYLGDLIKCFEKVIYKNSVIRGFILAVVVIAIVAAIAAFIQSVVMKLSVIPAVIILGVFASTGLASKTLKDYIKKVLLASTDEERRENLAIIVTRNTKLLDDKKVYSSLIESHSENLSDGVVAPLFYLIILGFPGLMVYKTISTLDSMIGYKNEKYENFGKVSAMIDDVANYIPARITGFIIWRLSRDRISWKNLEKEAKLYSSSPNAGYPVAAAAYNLGVKLGGPVYYGNNLVNKAEVGKEKTQDYQKAAFDFLSVHKKVDIIVLSALILYFALKMFII